MSWELLLASYVFGRVLPQILLLVATNVEPLRENLVKVEATNVETKNINLKIDEPSINQRL